MRRLITVVPVLIALTIGGCRPAAAPVSEKIDPRVAREALRISRVEPPPTAKGADASPASPQGVQRPDEPSVSREVEALATIKRLKGEIGVDDKRAGSPVVSVKLGSEAGDEALEYVSAFPQLEELHLWFSTVTDAGLASIAALTRLRKLTLTGARVTGPGLAHLRGLTRLEELSLSFTPVTDAGLSSLVGMTQLRTLSLTGCTEFGDAGLASIGGLTRLQTLEIMGTRVTDRGLSHLRGLAELRSIELCCCFEIGDAGLDRLRYLTGLVEVDVTGTNVTTAALTDFNRSAPRVHVTANVPLGMLVVFSSVLKTTDMEGRPSGIALERFYAELRYACATEALATPNGAGTATLLFWQGTQASRDIAACAVFEAEAELAKSPDQNRAAYIHSVIPLFERIVTAFRESERRIDRLSTSAVDPEVVAHVAEWRRLYLTWVAEHFSDMIEIARERKNFDLAASHALSDMVFRSLLGGSPSDVIDRLETGDAVVDRRIRAWSANIRNNKEERGRLGARALILRADLERRYNKKFEPL